MTLRAAGAIRAELVQLALPMPLEVLVSRAINSEGADGCHERLVYAWEIAIQIAATSTWAVCRHLGLRSDALDSIRSKLGRPAFGHWLELLRATRALLADRKEAAAVALAPLLDGLETRIEDDPRFVALAARMRELPKKPVKVGGKTLAALLDAMPAYRNETRGHGEPDTEFRESSNDIVLDALVAFARVAPLTGGYRIAVVHRLERTDGAKHRAELAMMEGTMSILERVDLSAELFASLSPARAYLRTRDDLFLPLFPAAAAVRSDEGWALGWLKQQVRLPTLSFESNVAGAFSLAIDRDELASLLSNDDDRRGAAEDAASAEVLALDPWRGLLAYGEEHKDLFFGRGEEIVVLGSRLAREGAVVLCGASGSGKSSLMRAGLLPKLRADAVERGAILAPIVFMPGAHPLAALRAELLRLAPADATDATRWSRLLDEMLPATAGDAKPDALVHLARGLAATGRHLAVLVDQLEEAATLATDASERHAFLDLVTTLAREGAPANAAVVCTVRADKLGTLLEHEGLRDVVRKSLEPVATLGRHALLEVVTAPLRGRRVAIDAGLAERIAADVGDEPGGLALVSQVLATLWDDRGRHGDRLTLAAYDALGGVTGVLGSQAELARSESKAPPQELDGILVQLAQRGDDRAFTRRRAEVAALAESIGKTVPELEAIIEPFVRRRLLVLAEGTVEVAHETLLRGWPMLRELLERESAVTELRQEIEQAATAWLASRERGERGELWTDDTSRLRRAEELLAGKRMPLSKREVAFLGESRKKVQRAVRARRIGVAAIGLLLVAAVVLSVGALAGWRKAQRNEKLVREAVDGARNNFITQSLRFTEGWTARSDSIVSALRARELETSLALPPTPKTLEALTFAVTQGHSFTDGWVSLGTGFVVKPDLVVILEQRGFAPGTLDVHRGATGKRLRTIDDIRGYVGRFGAKFVLKRESGYQVVDVATGDELPFLPVEWAMGVAPDRWLVFMDTTTQGYYFLLDDHGRKIASFNAPILENRTVQRAGMIAAPDVKRLLFSAPAHCHDCLRRLVDVNDGLVVTELPPTVEASYAQNGSSIVDVLDDGTIEKRDGNTGAVLSRAKSQPGVSAKVSPNGRGVLSGLKAMSSLSVKFDDGYDAALTLPRPAMWNGWLDGDTYAFCPSCTIVRRATQAHPASTVAFGWGDAVYGVEDPCSGIVFGEGLFARTTCDGRHFDFAAFDDTMRRGGIEGVLADGSIVANVPGVGVKVWVPRFPSIVKTVAPPSYLGSTVDPETGRVATWVGKDLVVVADRDGTELWRFEGRGLEAVGRHAELAVRLENGALEVIDGRAHRSLHRIDAAKLPPESEAPEMDRAGRMLLAINSTSAALFDPMTGKEISGIFPTGEGWSQIAAVGDDGCHFALRRGKTVEVWDGCTKNKVATTEKLTPPFSVSFSAGAKKVLIASENEPVKLLDAQTGAPLGDFGAPAKRVGAISPDGSRIIAQDEGTTCVWDTATRKRLGCLAMIKAPRRAEAAADGKLGVVVQDLAVRIFDLATVTEVASVQDEAQRAVLLGGDRLFTETNARYSVWKLGEPDLMRAACWHARTKFDYASVESVCKAYVEDVRKTSFPELSR